MSRTAGTHCRRFANRPGSGAVPAAVRRRVRRCLLQALAQSSSPVAAWALGFRKKLTFNPVVARNVIFLYMDGGPSQVDTFDYKPLLERFDGRDPTEVIGKLAPTQFDNIGKVLKSQWEFKQHGQCGHWISSLFPYLAEVADDLAMIKSMTSDFSEHTAANYFLHTGSGISRATKHGRGWLGYGLGSENENLPGFVVLNGGLIPPGRVDCFGSGFLPSAYQGSVFLPQQQPRQTSDRPNPISVCKRTSST